MPAITRTFKDDKVVLKTRISHGFDENGKRIRNRYSFEIPIVDYPTEELQDKAFIEYLASIGVDLKNNVKKKNIDNLEEKKNILINEDILESKNVINAIEDINKSTRQIVKIPLNKLEMFELNPSRPSNEFIERLAKSIYEDGLNNPIRVIQSNGKYLIETGNKRYRAYRLLEEKYGEQYSSIECYVVDYTIELNNENLDPVFTLKLMRDNVNTYERTINDKILEVELYHRIFPDLKKRGIAEGRENEWIGKEMGIADASVKDYLKLIKVDDVKKKFLNDKIDYLQTALRLVDYYNKYGQDDYYKMVGSIRETYQNDNDFQMNSYMVDQRIWNKEFEERQKKNKELQKQQEQKEEKEELIVEKSVKYEIPLYKELSELPYCYFEGNEIKKMCFRINVSDFELSFFMVNVLDNKEYYFKLFGSLSSVSFYIIKKPKNVNDFWYYTYYENKNGIFKLELEYEEYFKYDYFKFMRNIDLLLNHEHIVLTIDEEHNFIGDLLKDVIVTN